MTQSDCGNSHNVSTDELRYGDRIEVLLGFAYAVLWNAPGNKVRCKAIDENNRVTHRKGSILVDRKTITKAERGITIEGLP